MTPAAVAQRAATLPGKTLVYIPGIGETTLDDLRGATATCPTRAKTGPWLVLEIVAERWKVHPATLGSERRYPGVMVPRQVAMYAMKRMLGMTLNQVGDEFGGRDHSTVLYSIRRVEERIEASTTFSTVVQRICTEIGVAMREVES